MSVSIDEVRHLAALSEIDLSDDELKSLGTDIDNIVGYINQLDELDTNGIEPTFQLTGLKNVWREDVIEPQLAREKLLALAPAAEDNQVIVPKVL
ncbi:MAG: Asp-tRNA(Asn)/Glu-tRNA(Gln) amidotransferase subunit GatC [Candidatus Saccharibacteria bacterium]|nr:Asp-tRNA(Asn)/Glu-tRNA(Gln) amidotransferase subunit GatC [Candidatus Saccharibacteria bacterium]